jgi:hypothetical protein
MPVVSLTVMVVIPKDNQTLRWRTDKVKGVFHASRESCVFTDLPDTNLGEAAVGVHLLLPED